jgi:hypothetical protein
LVTHTFTACNRNASGPNGLPLGTVPPRLNDSVARSTTTRLCTVRGVAAPGSLIDSSPPTDRHTGLASPASALTRASTVWASGPLKSHPVVDSAAVALVTVTPGMCTPWTAPLRSIVIPVPPRATAPRRVSSVNRSPIRSPVAEDSVAYNDQSLSLV